MRKPTVEKFYRVIDGKVWRCDMDQAESVWIDMPYYEALLDAAQLVDRANGILRIQRERANADRGLVPKKARSGYLIKDWRYKIAQGKPGYRIKGIQIKLQTPYAVSDYRTMEDVFVLAQHDLKGIFPAIELWEEDYPQGSLLHARGYHLMCIYTGDKYWDVEFAVRADDVPSIPEELLP